MSHLKNFKTMSKLKVYYGLRKLTAKAVRKPSIIVVFENANNNMRKNEKAINRLMYKVHERFQTQGEGFDADQSNRMFTVYEIFLEDRNIQGDPERAIKLNFLQDANNVSLQERQLIAEKIRAEIYNFYHIQQKNNKQLRLF